MRFRAAAAFALLVVARAATAQTPVQPPADQTPDLINPDRPGIADGSKVIGSGRVQLETGIQQEYREEPAVAAASPTFTVPPNTVSMHTLFVPTLVRVGIGEHWEARVEGNTFTRVTTGGSSDQASGFAPLSVGFKYAFLDAAPGRPSLGAIVRVFPASGSGDFKTSHATLDARLVADWDVAPRFSINPNVGLARYESYGQTFSAFLFAFTLNYQPTDTVNPFIDIGYQSPDGPGGSGVAILDVGVAYIVGRNVQLDVSIGRGNASGPQPFIAAGISIRAGRSPHHP